MPLDSLKAAAEFYARDGFLSPVDILTADEAAHHRARMEEAEARIGPLHYMAKMHTILLSPLEERTLPHHESSVPFLVSGSGPSCMSAVNEVFKQSSDRQAPIFSSCQSPTNALTSSVRSIPTGHQVIQRPHPTQPDAPNWSIQLAILCVSHMR